MFYYFEKYYKPILFSVVNCIGLLVLQNIRFVNQDYFAIASVAYITLTVVLLYLDHQTHKTNQLNNKPVIFDNTIHVASLIQHYILPLWLIISLLFLLYINIDRNLQIFYIIGTSITLLFCYVNIKSYYENYFLIEKRTHLVYDFIKIFLFIINSNVLLYYYFRTNLNITALYTAFVCLTFFLIFLIAFRNFQDLKKTLIRILVGCTLMVLFLYWCLIILHLGVIQTNIAVIMLFYILSAYIHHDIDGTLTMEVFTEYIIWFSLMAAVIWGIS